MNGGGNLEETMCEKCRNEARFAQIEESMKKNSETHEKFYNNFESLRTTNAVREERDKSIDKSLAMIIQTQGELKAIVTEMQNRPIKQVDKIWDKVLDKLISGAMIAIAGYIIFVLK